MSEVQTSAKELPKDRPASMDEHGHHVNIHPTDVKGPVRRWRKLAQLMLMVLFLVLPWIQINGHPAILLDIGQRRFAILGLTFWAHDAPMLIFVFGGVLLGISLVTALWGRLWCGWACPETVFVDFVYRQLERWIEGNAVQRKRLDASPWTLRKIWLRSFKWFSFLVVSLVITHSFIAYFVGIDHLARMMRQSPAENPGTFGFMAFLTLTLLFAFGWFREQFCIIMCPYGRFQSVLLDDNSKIVAYDVARGEPRRGSAQAEPGETPLPMGDCIDCFRCVTVCPTGMDIRRGLQLECISCMACMDACDEVMRNVKKPTGLIRYTSQNEMAGLKRKTFRPRVLVLSAALAVVLSGLSWVLLTRPPIKAAVFNAKTGAYQTLQEPTAKQVGLYGNQFYLVASNYSFEDGQVRIKSENPEIKVVTQMNPVPLKAGGEKQIGFFLTFPKSVLQAGIAHLKLSLETQAEDQSWQRTLTQEVSLVGPH